MVAVQGFIIYIYFRLLDKQLVVDKSAVVPLTDRYLMNLVLADTIKLVLLYSKCSTVHHFTAKLRFTSFQLKSITLQIKQPAKSKPFGCNKLQVFKYCPTGIQLCQAIKFGPERHGGCTRGTAPLSLSMAR